VDNSDLRSVIETKCWIEGVYIDNDLIYGEIGKEITRYGVGPYRSNERRGAKSKDINTDYIFQNYYQWVAPVLLMLAFFFYLPRVIWRIWENGRMQNLLDGTGKSTFASTAFRLTKFFPSRHTDHQRRVEDQEGLHHKIHSRDVKESTSIVLVQVPCLRSSSNRVSGEQLKHYQKCDVAFNFHLLSPKGSQHFNNAVDIQQLLERVQTGNLSLS